MAKRITIVIDWNLWLERNRRNFCDIAYSLDHCIYNITNNVSLWTIAFGDVRTTSCISTPKTTAVDIPRSAKGTATANVDTVMAIEENLDYEK